MLTEKQKKEQKRKYFREYMREWRKKNPMKVKLYNIRASKKREENEVKS